MAWNRLPIQNGTFAERQSLDWFVLSSNNDTRENAVHLEHTNNPETSG